MRSLSVATVIEKNKLASGSPFIPMLDVEVVDPTTGVVVETMHFCRNNEDLDYQGITYIATNFDLELKEEQGGQNSVSLSIVDFSRALQARMQAYGGGIGFNVTVMIVNGGALEQPPEVIEYFQVMAANAANYRATFTLGAENALMVTFPKRRQTRDFCQWRYKDPDTCAYVGGLTTCDLTLNGANGCSAHNNTPNFGGFPALNQTGIRYA